MIDNYPLSGVVDGSSSEYERQFLVVGKEANQRMHVPRVQAVHAIMVSTNWGETTRDNDLR